MVAALAVVSGLVAEGGAVPVAVPEVTGPAAVGVGGTVATDGVAGDSVGRGSGSRGT